MDKNELRKKYLEIRKCIKNSKEKSRVIEDLVINTEEYRKAQVVALYKALSSEVNTDYLIEHSLNLGKIVCLLRVEDESIVFYMVNSLNDELEFSKFGVLEPKKDKEKIVPKEAIDLAIVPGVAFDEKCNRLGFGKGYYDRFLSLSDIDTIGICFEEQVLKNGRLPVDKYDISMNSIITEDRVIARKIEKSNIDINEKGM